MRGEDVANLLIWITICTTFNMLMLVVNGCFFLTLSCSSYKYRLVKFSKKEKKNKDSNTGFIANKATKSLESKEEMIEMNAMNANTKDAKQSDYLMNEELYTVNIKS